MILNDDIIIDAWRRLVKDGPGRRLFLRQCRAVILRIQKYRQEYPYDGNDE